MGMSAGGNGRTLLGSSVGGALIGTVLSVGGSLLFESMESTAFVMLVLTGALAGGVGGCLVRRQLQQVLRQWQAQQEAVWQERQEQWETERAALVAAREMLQQRVQALEAMQAHEEADSAEGGEGTQEAENGVSAALQQFWTQSRERLQTYLQLLGDQLDHVQQETEEAALEIVAELQQLHKAAQLQVTQIQQLAASMEHMSQHNTHQAHSIREAGQQMSDFVDQYQVRVEESLQRISRMAAEVGQLEPLVDDMADIARRTNLLALNAAIEAARLGEEGKGFAVVADAVRQLAMQASSLADRMGRQIQTVCERIQEESGHIKDRLQLEVDQLSQMRAANAMLNERLHQIVQVTSDTVAQVRQLNDERLSRSLADLLGRIQFQDVLRQKIDLVKAALKRLSDFLEAAVRYQQHPDQSPPEPLDPDQLYQQYVSSGQRAVHQAALGHRSADDDAAPRIELFV
ncbi:MAG: methyl-accepting chemotaxis protein [Rhodothermus sp.]|nr:methyl-accepting chemotaxis protein [Rhodothermus sp.]